MGSNGQSSGRAGGAGRPATDRASIQTSTTVSAANSETPRVSANVPRTEAYEEANASQRNLISWASGTMSNDPSSRRNDKRLYGDVYQDMKDARVDSDKAYRNYKEAEKELKKIPANQTVQTEDGKAAFKARLTAALNYVNTALSSNEIATNEMKEIHNRNLNYTQRYEVGNRRYGSEALGDQLKKMKAYIEKEAKKHGVQL